MKAVKYAIYIICFLAALFVGTSYAQSVSASLTLDRDSILIGDQITATITLERPADKRIEWPIFDDELVIDSSSSLEIIAFGDRDTILSDRSVTEKQTLILTSWKEGFFPIPPQTFLGYDENDSANQIASTRPILLSVYTFDVDTTQGIVDVKRPMDKPFELAEIKNYLIIGGLVLLVALVAVLYFVIRKEEEPEMAPVIISKPAHVEAIERLEDLDKRQVWQKGNIKDYHSELSEIVRAYVERRWQILALETTTDELLSNFQKMEVGQEARQQIEELLSLSDLVKFAKVSPQNEEHSQAMILARGFVELTKEQPTANKEEEEKA